MSEKRQTYIVYFDSGEMRRMETRKIPIPRDEKERSLSFVEAHKLYEERLGRKPPRTETLSPGAQKDKPQKVSFPEANRVFEEELLGRRPAWFKKSNVISTRDHHRLRKKFEKVKEEEDDS